MNDHYIIIKGESLDMLASKVNDSISHGYDVQGGICAILPRDSIRAQYSQAMVKKDA